MGQMMNATFRRTFATLSLVHGPPTLCTYSYPRIPWMVVAGTAILTRAGSLAGTRERDGSAAGMLEYPAFDRVCSLTCKAMVFFTGYLVLLHCRRTIANRTKKLDSEPNKRCIIHCDADAMVVAGTK